MGIKWRLLYCLYSKQDYFVDAFYWPISYSFNHRYNYRSYLSIYTALVKSNHSVTIVLPIVERLRNWPYVIYHDYCKSKTLFKLSLNSQSHVYRMDRFSFLKTNDRFDLKWRRKKNEGCFYDRFEKYRFYKLSFLRKFVVSLTKVGRF